jgi:predicted tellurium resistance membrane protein TerC
VLTGGILGIIAMRLVVGQLLALIKRYPALVDGAFVIIGWVSIKLVWEYAFDLEWVSWQMPKPISIGIIVIIFVVSYLYARKQAPRSGEESS